MKVKDVNESAVVTMNVRFGNFLVSTLAGLMLFVLSPSSLAALEAKVERTDLALGDIAALTIISDAGEDLNQLNIQTLSRDFEILGQSSSSNMQIINGSVSRTTTLRIDITPKRQGIFSIPAFTLGQARTKPIQIKVGPPVVAPSGDSVLNFRAEIDTDWVYVQGQLRLTVTIERAINLDDLNVSELEVENAYVHTLEQQTFQRTIQGKPWIIHELRYAIFPEKSGEIEIPALRLSGREVVGGGGLFARSRAGKLLTRNTEPMRIEVRPIPYAYPDTPWLVAADLTLTDSLNRQTQANAGEALTRTLTLKGAGVQGVQLPPIPQAYPSDLKQYPDQPVIRSEETREGLNGERIESTAIIAPRTGEMVLPEIVVPYWNTTTDSLDQVVVPSVKMTIVGASDSQAQEPRPRDAFIAPPAPSRDNFASDTENEVPSITEAPVQDPIWMWVSASLALLWLLTIAWALTLRRPKTPPVPETSSSSDLTAALASAIDSARHNDAGQCLRDLHRLCKMIGRNAGSRSVSVDTLGAQLKSTPLTQEITRLMERAYSATAGAWDGSALAKLLRQHRPDIETLGQAQQQKPSLALYPQT